MTNLFGAIGGAIVALMLLAQPAEARCWWDGVRWHCTHRQYVRYAYPYPYYPYYPYYGPYYHGCFPWPFCW